MRACGVRQSNSSFSIGRKSNFALQQRYYATDLSKKHFNTKVIHAGLHPDPSTGAVMTTISLATTFKQKSPGVHQGYEYSRTGNPTRAALEECVGVLENGNWGLAFASGMAGTTAIVHLLNINDEIVSIDDVYGGTFDTSARSLNLVELN